MFSSGNYSIAGAINFDLLSSAKFSKGDDVRVHSQMRTLRKVG